MIGTIGFHPNKHGRTNSRETLNVWEEISNEETKDAGKLLRGSIFPSENDHIRCGTLTKYDLHDDFCHISAIFWPKMSI